MKPGNIIHFRTNKSWYMAPIIDAEAPNINTIGGTINLPGPPTTYKGILMKYMPNEQFLEVKITHAVKDRLDTELNWVHVELIRENIELI